MNILNDVVSLSQNPCTGICSTTYGIDDQCKGCGRTLEEIRDWNSYSDLQKKLINIDLAINYDIRQKKEYNNMSSNKTLENINGKLLTAQALIEMVGTEMLDEYGKNPTIKKAYQALVQAREKILEAKNSLPVALDQAS
tara:strand:+ start:137 stop:553 length:417 start_codon:yes stop_codon:yes gene_type:complete